MAKLTLGWALIAAGVAESWRRPASRAGLLLAHVGRILSKPGLDDTLTTTAASSPSLAFLRA